MTTILSFDSSLATDVVQRPVQMRVIYRFGQIGGPPLNFSADWHETRSTTSLDDLPRRKHSIDKHKRSSSSKKRSSRSKRERQSSSGSSSSPERTKKSTRNGSSRKRTRAFDEDVADDTSPSSQVKISKYKKRQRVPSPHGKVIDDNQDEKSPVGFGTERDSCVSTPKSSDAGSLPRQSPSSNSSPCSDSNRVRRGGLRRNEHRKLWDESPPATATATGTFEEVAVNDSMKNYVGVNKGNVHATEPTSAHCIGTSQDWEDECISAGTVELHEGGSDVVIESKIVNSSVEIEETTNILPQADSCLFSISSSYDSMHANQPSDFSDISCFGLSVQHLFDQSSRLIDAESFLSI